MPEEEQYADDASQLRGQNGKGNRKRKVEGEPLGSEETPMKKGKKVAWFDRDTKVSAVVQKEELWLAHAQNNGMGECQHMKELEESVAGKSAEVNKRATLHLKSLQNRLQALQIVSGWQSTAVAQLPPPAVLVQALVARAASSESLQVLADVSAAPALVESAAQAVTVTPAAFVAEDEASAPKPADDSASSHVGSQDITDQKSRENKLRQYIASFTAQKSGNATVVHKRLTLAPPSRSYRTLICLHQLKPMSD